MKKVLAITLGMFILILTSGCSRQTDLPGKSQTSENADMEDPFQSEDLDTVIMGAIEHGPRTPHVDDHEKLLPWTYDGQEVRMEYYVSASGQAKNVGFLIFINGVPQPYKVDDTSAPYEYMHTFKLKKDNIDLPFTFLFSPVTGKQGETLDVTISSIYNPDFMPDMDKTTSYGGYHAFLPASYQLIFLTDAKKTNYKPRHVDGNVQLTKEPVTNKLLETLSDSGMENVDMDTFNKEIYSLIYYDDSMKMDNYKVNKKGTLHVTYKLCGQAGLQLTTSFYINHQPITIGEGTSVETTIEKGSASVINLDINLEEMADFNTFYAVSVPNNANDFPEDIFEAEKTYSILLYKQGE